MLTKTTAAVVLMVTLFASCGEERKQAETTPAPKANPAAFKEGTPYRPAIDPADFVDKIDNPYLPLFPGTTWRYEGSSDGEPEVNTVTVTDDAKTILGVVTTVVRDQVFVDDELAEDTFDWFAQDKHGNVWYFGEDTKEYEGGKVTTMSGSWEAGVDGARPGIVMLGSPRVGDRYREEYYKGEAEDVGRVVALDRSKDVPFGSFDEVIVIEGLTRLEPGVVERKYFARGIGQLMEELVEGGEEVSSLVDVTPKPKT